MLRETELHDFLFCPFLVATLTSSLLTNPIKYHLPHKRISVGTVLLAVWRKLRLTKELASLLGDIEQVSQIGVVFST